MLNSDVTDKERFRILSKFNNSYWKKAVCWLYHEEPEELVVDTFSLDELQLSTAKVAVDILRRQNAEYNRVHKWANPINSPVRL